MDNLLSCALFLDQQLITIKKIDSESNSTNINTTVNRNVEVVKLLKVAASLNKIILSKKQNLKIDFGKVVPPEYNLENLGLSADTLKFLRQSNK